MNECYVCNRRAKCEPGERCGACQTLADVELLLQDADPADRWDVFEVYADKLRSAVGTLRYYEKTPVFSFMSWLDTFFSKSLSKEQKLARICGSAVEEETGNDEATDASGAEDGGDATADETASRPQPQDHQPKRRQRDGGGFGMPKAIPIRSDARSQLNACRFLAQDATNLAVDVMLGHSQNLDLLLETLEQATALARQAREHWLNSRLDDSVRTA